MTIMSFSHRLILVGSTRLSSCIKGGQVDAHPDRHDAKINDHLHGRGGGIGPILEAAAVCAARPHLEVEVGWAGLGM